MRNFIPASITSKVALAGLKLSKHSPHILFGAGIVGVAASGVLAARATLKLEFVLDDHEEMSTKIADAFQVDQNYGVKERRHDLALLYTRTTVEITKLYGPALVVGGLAVAALTGSHRILTKRNAALTAAYAAVDKGFREYRGRVVEEHGAEKDREYAKGVKTEQVTETSEDGKSVTVSEKKIVTGASPYGVLFNAGNPNWNERPELNFMFLRGAQNYMNDKLHAQGYLFLSDVLDYLGFQQTKASRVVGWHKNAKNGDNYVDFGVFEDASDLRVWEYLTGRESELYLDFNVAGVVHDLL